MVQGPTNSLIEMTQNLDTYMNFVTSFLNTNLDSI